MIETIGHVPASTIAVVLMSVELGETPVKHCISLDSSRVKDTRAEDTCGLWYWWLLLETPLMLREEWVVLVVKSFKVVVYCGLVYYLTSHPPS